MDHKRLKHEHIPEDLHEYARHLQERLDSESRRFENLYQINPYDTAHYDLVVDTAANNLEQVAKIIQDAYTAWL